MSSNIELIPRPLKLISLIGLSSLAIVMAVIYLSSPKLLLEDLALEKVDDPLLSTISQPLKDDARQPQTSSSPAASVESVVESDPNSSASNTDPADPSASSDSSTQPTPTVLASTDTQTRSTKSAKEKNCQYSKSRKPVILGIKINKKKIYLLPHTDSQQYNFIAQKAKKLESLHEIVWFCTIDQAIKAGWQPASHFNLFGR